MSTFARTSGTEKKRQIAERHVPRNNPRKNCGAHFGSSSLLVSKVAKEFIGHVTIELQFFFPPQRKEKYLQIKSYKNSVKFQAWLNSVLMYVHLLRFLTAKYTLKIFG